MSGFTEEQIAQLSAKLDRAHVTNRPHAGRKLSYIEAWHAIAEANRIFGFDAWNRETVEMREVDARKAMLGQEPRQYEGFKVAYVARVRIEVRVGECCVCRDGTGFGQGIDRDMGLAHESAVKEAESDAMKRALMTFGNPFGLALYDKKQENVGTVNDGVAMADTREMEQGFVKLPVAGREAPSPTVNPVPAEAGEADPITVTTDRRIANTDRLGPPQHRRSVSRETPTQEAGAGEDQRMVPAPRLVEMASQAANKGMWALQEFCKVLEPVERASIKQVVIDQLQPIARMVDEKRNMQPRIDAELASRELADQGIENEIR